MTLDSVEELEYIKSNIVVQRSRYEEYIWVGASDMDQEGVFKWITNGNQIDDQFWNSGEPNNRGGMLPLHGIVILTKSRRALCNVPQGQAV